MLHYSLEYLPFTCISKCRRDLTVYKQYCNVVVNSLSEHVVFAWLNLEMLFLGQVRMWVSYLGPVYLLLLNQVNYTTDKRTGPVKTHSNPYLYIQLYVNISWWWVVFGNFSAYRPNNTMSLLQFSSCIRPLVCYV